jgi:hypothetical protein
MTKNVCAYITVPEMDSRQMRLISYSGDKLFSTRTEELSTVEVSVPVSVKQQFLMVF